MNYSNKILLILISTLLVCTLGCSSTSKVTTFIKANQAKQRPTTPLLPTLEVSAISTNTPTITITPQQTITLCPPSSSTNLIPTKIAPSKNYIGLVLRNEPEDFEKGVLQFSDTFFWHEKYGLASIFYKNNYAYLLEELICKDKNGDTYFKVIDEIHSLTETASLFVSCKYLKTENPDTMIVAIGHYLNNDQQKTIVTRAWQADFNKKAFVELSNEQVNKLLCH